MPHTNNQREHKGPEVLMLREYTTYMFIGVTINQNTVSANILVEGHESDIYTAVGLYANEKVKEIIKISALAATFSDTIKKTS